MTGVQVDVQAVDDYLGETDTFASKPVSVVDSVSKSIELEVVKHRLPDGKLGEYTTATAKHSTEKYK